MYSNAEKIKRGFKMALYLISYDINEKDAYEYDSLYASLKALRATRILYSEWVVIAKVGEAGDIYNSLVLNVQAKDKLLVQEILADAYWGKLMISDDAFRTLLNSARR